MSIIAGMSVQESSCTLRVVINTAAPFVLDGLSSNSSFEPTFNDYLNSKLQSDLNCTFVTTTTFSQTDAYQAVVNGSADLVLTNSGTHACLAVRQNDIAPSLRAAHHEFTSGIDHDSRRPDSRGFAAA